MTLKYESTGLSSSPRYTFQMEAWAVLSANRGPLGPTDRAAAAGEEPTDIVETPASDSAATEFGRRMIDAYHRARKEAGYHAGYFRSMLAEHGPVLTARKLLAAPTVSDGFSALWEHERLDLTVEALVIEPQFAGLFDEKERETARNRLAQFGFQVAERS
jgi:hypothetical protein